MRHQLALTLCAMTALAGGPALAGAQCAPHENVMKGLASRYGESRQVVALAANDMVMEVWANAETGTWTVTLTQPGGPTCMVASGEAWQQVSEALPPDDDPA